MVFETLWEVVERLPVTRSVELGEGRPSTLVIFGECYPTVTVNVIEWDSEPLVAVTVTV